MAIASPHVSNENAVVFRLGATFPSETFYAKAVPALREVIDGAFVRADLTHVGKYGGTLVKLTDAALDKVMKDRGHRFWWLTSSKDKAPEVALDCHRLQEALTIRVTLRGGGLRRHAPTLAASIETMTWAVLDAYGKRASISGDVCPLLEPPIRTPKTLKRGPYHPAAVVDVLDRRDLEDGDPEWLKLQRKMRAAALPRSVRVVERGDVTMWFWTDKLGDVKAMRAACRQRQQWLVRTLWK